MARVEKTVFLSYRRTNAPWALSIYQNLTANGFDVFFDYKGIASGDFESVILENIRARAHFLVALTPSTLERCADPGDWLRREIEEAIECRRNIVPLLLEGFDFGASAVASQLTGRLAELKKYNGPTLPVEYFDAAMERLREKFLNVPVDTVLQRASAFAREAAKHQQAAAGLVSMESEKRKPEEERTHEEEKQGNTEEKSQRREIIAEEGRRLEGNRQQAIDETQIERPKPLGPKLDVTNLLRKTLIIKIGIFIALTIAIATGAILLSRNIGRISDTVVATTTTNQEMVSSVNKNIEEAKPQIKDKPVTQPIKKSTGTFADKKDENVTITPNNIVDAVVAGGGKYIILKLQFLNGLMVYDTTEKKIVKTIPLPGDNFLYTAGSYIVLVYFPENNLLQTWSLETFNRLKVKPNPKGAIITCMTMGHSNGNRALVRYAVGTGALDKADMYLLDLNTLQEIPSENLEKKRTGHNSSYRDYVHQRSDGALRIISEWATSHSPSGLGIYLISENSWSSAYEHDSVGYVAVGDDGRIYTQTGGIYNNQITKIAVLPNRKLIPGIGGTLFLGISDNGSMQVYSSGSTIPMGPVDSFPGLEDEKNYRQISGAWAISKFIFDRHIIFDPTHGYILIIPPENDKIIQRNFDLKQFVEQEGVDYLIVTSAPNNVVTPGELWKYKINTLSSNDEIKYFLEFGPKGMEIGVDGTVTWKVPSTYSNSSEKIIVLIRNKNGKSIYHSFEINVKTLVQVSPKN